MSAPHSSNGNGAADHTVDGMNHHGRRIQEIIEQIDAMPNPAAKALMHECMESVLGFYGDGLERILNVVKRSGIDGRKVMEDLLADQVVSSLLLIHGLHPRDLPARLRDALDKVRPYMESHGGNVELLGLENDFARLRLQGSCKTCPSSSVTLELAVRHAIEEACPDLAGFEVEGMPAGTPDGRHIPNGAPEWIDIPKAAGLAAEAMTAVHAGETPLILCKVAGQLYAYRDHCPACNLPLHLGRLEGQTLACSLGHQCDVPHAGKSLDGSSLHLEPVPILTRDGTAKVALNREPTTASPVEAGTVVTHC
jgi:Fe-S cluster biogenesis protein NfuA/nitrite reductase/ring-hydroxylating ferredoxin subunit